jgi:hypothetical protein
MIETLSHPAQSAEFLSRRHDGELTPAEAAAFEAHRRECPECEGSVADFERALAAYRSAPVTPHATDLSARILRKIRAASPSRRPFGVMFGIDVRWAGALAAALLVVIIGAPVFSGRKLKPSIGPATPPAPASAPIPAYVLDAEEERPVEKRAEARQAAPPPAAPRSAQPARPSADDAAGDFGKDRAQGARENETRRDELAATSPVNADKPDQVAAVQERSMSATSEAKAPFAPAPPSQPQQAGATEQTPGLAARRRSASAPVGAEAGAGAEGTASTVEVKLVIQPADGGGEAPEIVSTPSDDRLAALRGRMYLLVLEPGGRVIAVEEQPAGGKLAKDAKEKAEEADAQTSARMRSAESLLRELVFRPGDRSRRLVVAVR